MKRTTNILIIILLIIGLFSLFTLAAYSVNGQTAIKTDTDLQSTGGQFTIRKSVVAGGGGSLQQPGQKTVNGTGGQTAAGRYLTGGTFAIHSGFWTPDGLAPSAAGVTISGKVTTNTGAGLRNALVVLTDPEGGRRTTITGSFGYYQFDDVESGRTYTLAITSKRYQFETRILNVLDALTDIDFVGIQ